MLCAIASSPTRTAPCSASESGPNERDRRVRSLSTSSAVNPHVTPSCRAFSADHRHASDSVILPRVRIPPSPQVFLNRSRYFATVSNYLRVAQRFLLSRFRAGSVRLSAPRVADATRSDVITCASQDEGVGDANNRVSFLDQFKRYCLVGWCQRALGSNGVCKPAPGRVMARAAPASTGMDVSVQISCEDSRTCQLSKACVEGICVRARKIRIGSRRRSASSIAARSKLRQLAAHGTVLRVNCA
jgi:hypothetical protein